MKEKFVSGKLGTSGETVSHEGALQSGAGDAAKQDYERHPDGTLTASGAINCLMDERDAAYGEMLARGDTIKTLAAEIVRLKRLLYHRDGFIVNNDLWCDYVATLPHTPLTAQPTIEERTLVSDDAIAPSKAEA